MKQQKKIQRCAWVPEGHELYERYHDEEWGVPLHDDRRLFEFIVLESAQAGLSWEIVLKKREGYRKAFAKFDPRKVSRFTTHDIERLVQDASIIRNRAKIKATVNNAQRFLEMQKAFGSFNAYLWQWVKDCPLDEKRKTIKDLPARTVLSDKLAKDLKQRGFSFLGSTVCYAHMQAVGMINDHTRDCFRYQEIKKL